jgi:hypothetical protein
MCTPVAVGAIPLQEVSTPCDGLVLCRKQRFQARDSDSSDEDAVQEAKAAVEAVGAPYLLWVVVVGRATR